MGKVHPEQDELSAFADDELDQATSQVVRRHLDICPRCSSELAALTRLDGVLASTPAVSCAGSRDLRSALLDGQLTAHEGAVAREHIVGCPTCSEDEIAWLAADRAVRSLPAGMPSARADAAIRALTERRARRAIFPIPSGLAPTAGLRLGLAALLVFGIVAGLIPGQAPEQARAPEQEAVLVSAAQEIVHYQPTNTFYVLQQQQAAVDAIDAATNVQRAHIVVGGNPTALALDSFASRILVLDSSTKSLIEIDPAINLVVKSTPVDVAGTPTSVRVANDGKVLVTAAREPGQGTLPRGPRPTPESKAGEVAVLDTQRKLEVIRVVEVAPRQVVTDPQGRGALFVSEDATTLVDRTYQPLRALPGGIDAAYGTSGWIAVLGASGADAVLHLIGDGAPQPLRLTGKPLAVTSMPEGGFAVLLGSGSGNGRIVVIDEAGAAVGTTPVDQVGPDLSYDPGARRFAVLSAGKLVSAPLPASIVAREPERSVSPAPSAPSVLPSPGPNRSDLLVSPSPIVSPAPQVSPSASPRASAPVAVASPSTPPGVPQSARRLTDSLYRVPLGGMPILTTSSPSHIWFLDQDNVMNAIDPSTGAQSRVVLLPKGAMISAIAATPSYVFALDPIAGTIYLVDALTARVSSDSVPLFRGATGLTTDGGSQVWLASGSSPELFSMDARTRRLAVYDVGMEAQVVAFDGTRGVWFSDGDKRIGFYDFRTGLATELALGSEGSARSLLPDPSGTLWVGTTAGEVIAVRERTKETVAHAGRSIVALALDPQGTPWYLAGSRASLTRFVYAPAVPGAIERELNGPATSFAFNARWRAWLADPLGGFYLGLESAK